MTTKKLHFLTVGRLHWIKGHSYVLEALSKLKNENIDFEYSIIGDGEDLLSLRFLIHQLKLEDNVELVGQVDHSEIPQYYKRADYYIQYSVSEGFCNAVLEAQLAGLLCIVSDGGGLPENVIHHKTGWIVPKRNAQALTHILLKITRLPEKEKEVIRLNAKQHVKQNLNIEKYHKAFNEFYLG